MKRIVFAAAVAALSFVGWGATLTAISTNVTSTTLSINASGDGLASASATVLFEYGFAADSLSLSAEAEVSFDANGVGTYELLRLSRETTYFVCAKFTPAGGDQITTDVISVKTLPLDEKVLPAGYQQVEYIQSTATSKHYIDTGVIGRGELKSHTKMSWVTVPKDSSFLASRIKGSTRYYLVHYASGWGYGYDAWSGGSGSASPAPQIYDVSSVLKLGDQHITVNGTTVKSGTNNASYDTNYSLYLFACNISGSPDYHCSALCYELQIWEQGVLTRDYVPCYSAADDAYGLYDFCGTEKRFYKSATATGLSGPDLVATDRAFNVVSTNDEFATFAISANATESTLYRVDGQTYGGKDVAAWGAVTKIGTIDASDVIVTNTAPFSADFGKTVYLSRFFLVTGTTTNWSETAVREPALPIAIDKRLSCASSAVGSSDIAATVMSIGETASSATLTFRYGMTPDCADGTVTVAGITDAGECRGTIPHCVAGKTYFVKATLENDDGESVESDVWPVVQPEVAEDFGDLSPFYVATDHLVAWWDGVNNAGMGQHDASATSWTDLSGHGRTLGNFASGVTWTDNAFAMPTEVHKIAATVTGITMNDYKAYEIVFAADREVGPRYAGMVFGIGGLKGLVLFSGTSGKSRGFQIVREGRFFLCDYDITGKMQQVYTDFDDNNSPDKSYHNGTSLSSVGYTEGWTQNQSGIGYYNSTDYSFYGRIAALRLYDRKLTDEEREWNLAVDNARFSGGPSPFELKLQDGRLVLTVSASVASGTTVSLFAGESYGGTNGWGAAVETGMVAEGKTTVEFDLPENWGSSVWFARVKVGEGDEAAWSNTLVAEDANLPQATLADARALGTDKFVLSGTLNSFVGGSCTVTPVVTDSSGTAIDFSAAAKTFDAPGEFAFDLPASITAGKTYSVCVEMSAGGKKSRSKTLSVAVGTAGSLTPLGPGETAPIEVAVEGVPDARTTVTPAYGRYAAEENKVYSFSAPTSASIDGRNYSLRGYEIYEGETMTAAVKSNEFTFATDRGGFRVVWRWDVDYETTVEVSGGNGSAFANQPTVTHGEAAHFTAVPNTGYAVAWTGDVPNGQMFGNELKLENVQGPVHVIASFFEPSANPSDAAKTGLFATYAHLTSLTFAGYEGETALADFPALIRLSEEDGGFSYADCQPDGRDVRFCTADGRELDSEVVSWNPNGTSEFWVKVPSLTKSTRIFAVWGNSSAPARTPRTYAFNKGYRGVWTMESAKNVLLDRSVYGQHAPCFEWAVTSVVDGVVGGARRFSGTSDCYAYLGLGDVRPMEPEEFTAECWFRVAEYPADWTYFLASGTRTWNNTSQACTFGIDKDGRIFGSNCGGYVANAGNRKYPWSKEAVASKGEWHHAAYTQAANGEEFLYLDGVMVGCYTNVMANFGWGKVFYSGTSRPGNPTLGGWWPNATKDNYRYYAGDMDEARLSGEVRSADWLRATYLNVASNATFAVFDGDYATLTVDGAPQPLAPMIEVAAPEIEQGGVRRTCMGYAVVADGKMIDSGAGTSVARAWPKGAKDVAIAWNWKTKYAVSVDGVSDWYEAGTVLPVAAGEAPEGQAFHSWGGNCPTLEVFSASFDLPVDGPRTLTANYAPLTEVSTNGCADADEAGMALKSAIDAAVAAGTPQVVLVDDGVYAIAHPNVLTISSPVVVRSKNGFEKTALLQLKNPASNNPAWTMIDVSHAGALLEGLDFQCYGGYGGAVAGVASVTAGHFSKCRFIMQTGRSFGANSGARFLTQSGGWCRGCVFTAFDDIVTRSNNSGGGGSFDNMIMDSCVVTNLMTPGGIYSTWPIRVGANAVIRNTLVAKNFSQSGRDGGAVSINGSSAKGIVFENCTIADNKNFKATASTAKGGGIYTDYPLLVVNTILSGNLANGSVLGDDFYGPVGAVHSMSKDFTGGEFGSMTALPAYVLDEDGTTDPLYRTRGVSPSRDAGYPTVWSRSLGAWDFLGSNRVAEAAVDIGACEYAPSEAEEFDVNVRIEGDFNQRDRVEATFIAAVSGAKGKVTYAWDFGDGTTSTEANPTHVYTHGGWYTVRLEVSDEGEHRAVYDSPSPVKVKPSVCYINDAGSATPPYATRETGAKGGSSLADVFGDRPQTIVICSNTVARNVRGSTTQVNFPVTIVGEDRETSTMDYVVNVTGPGTVLSSLTYTGGDGSYTGLSVSKTLVTNVVFRNAKVTGNGFALKADEGTRIVDSVFVNINPNHASGGTGSAALMIVGKDVVVDRCVVTNNFSASSAGTYAAGIRVTGAYDPMPVVRNSFIGYNRCFDTATRMNAVGGAGIYAEGPVRVENCTIVSNQTCGAGSAVYVKAGAAEIVNTIIACNAGGLTNAAEICSNEVFVAEGASVTWTKSRVPAEAGINDAGVTTADPKFNFGRRAGIPYWGLQGNSPLKNKGVKLDWMTPEAKDLSGRTRIFNGRPDLGCYESQFGGMVIFFR